MEEIQQVVERINFSWEKGLMSPEEYIEKRTQLQREMESLRPVEYDDLMEAADLLTNYRIYWEKCAELDNPKEARKQLLAKIVDRVFVYDQQVIAVALHSDFGVILDEDLSVPSEVLEAVAGEIKSHNVLGRLICGVIPANEAVTYSHHRNQSLFSYDPRAAASKAYAQLVGKLARQFFSKRGE